MNSENKKKCFLSKCKLLIGIVTLSVLGVVGCSDNEASTNDKSEKAPASSNQQEKATGYVYDSKGIIIDANSNIMKSIGEDSAILEKRTGNDISLTIDSQLQKSIDLIIEEELTQQKQKANTELLDRAYVVLMEPKTGAILSMSGKQYVKDEQTGDITFQDITKSNITESYTMGSVVTGATVLAGYETGAIQPGHGFYDAPMQIKGTPPKQSWENMGYINDLTAIKQSSDVYMYNLAINIGEGTYRPNQSLELKDDGFDKLRSFYKQLGLGVETGIDLSDEKIGYEGQEKISGKLLDLAIGQYDTYTPIQLAQYVSAIANGGQRLQPYLLKETREMTDDQNKQGAIKKATSPNVLNKVELDEKYIQRVQHGFEKVMQEEGGTGYSAFSNTAYNMAGKTGTAEAFYDGPLKSESKEPIPTTNQTLVGYAPADQPEVAIAVVVPWAFQGDNGHSMNMEIARKVMDVYFNQMKSAK